MKVRQMMKRREEGMRRMLPKMRFSLICRREIERSFNLWVSTGKGVPLVQVFKNAIDAFLFDDLLRNKAVKRSMAALAKTQRGGMDDI